MTAAEQLAARLRACIGPDRSTEVGVDDQVELTLALLQCARSHRDDDGVRADVRRLIGETA